MSKITPGTPRAAAAPSLPLPRRDQAGPADKAAAPDLPRKHHPDKLQELVLIAAGTDGTHAIEAMNREHRGHYSDVSIALAGRRDGDGLAAALGDAAARGASTLDDEVIKVTQLDDGSFRLQFRQGPAVDTRRLVFAADFGTPPPELDFPASAPSKSNSGWEIPGKENGLGMRFEGGVTAALERRAGIQEKRAAREARLASLNDSWEALAQLRDEKIQIRQQLGELERKPHGAAHSDGTMARRHVLELQQRDVKRRYSEGFNRYCEDVRAFDADQPFEPFTQQAFDVLDFCAFLSPDTGKHYQKFDTMLRQGASTLGGLEPNRPLPPVEAADAAARIVIAGGIGSILLSQQPLEQQCQQLAHLGISPETIAVFRRDMNENGHSSQTTTEMMHTDIQRFFRDNLYPASKARPASLLV